MCSKLRLLASFEEKTLQAKYKKPVLDQSACKVYLIFKLKAQRRSATKQAYFEVKQPAETQ
jgi:hypothetical protein